MATDQLVAFQRVVREGSFSRAAFALGLGQPAVSARIAALEQAVGGTLFTRGRRVALTPLGESFLPYVRRALEVLQEGLASARAVQVGTRGRVSLASLNSLAGGLVGPALAQLLRAHPGLECVTKATDHEHVLELLWDGLCELGLCAWPCTEAFAADLEPLLLLREPVLLVAAPSHPLARLKKLQQDDLVRLARPLHRLRWWRYHHPEIIRLAEASGTSVEVPMETARHLVVNGLGVGFFTRTYIMDDLAAGRLAPLLVRDLAPIHRDSALVRRARATPLSPPAALLVDALRSNARALDLLAPRPRRPSRRPAAQT
jgi:DNA-binding transcriptional LysR family regulator